MVSFKYLEFIKNNLQSTKDTQKIRDKTRNLYTILLLLIILVFLKISVESKKFLSDNCYLFCLDKLFNRCMKTQISWDFIIQFQTMVFVLIHNFLTKFFIEGLAIHMVVQPINIPNIIQTRRIILLSLIIKVFRTVTVMSHRLE